MLQCFGFTKKKSDESSNMERKPTQTVLTLQPQTIERAKIEDKVVPKEPERAIEPHNLSVASAQTDSCVHSENAEVSLGAEWPITNLSKHMIRRHRSLPKDGSKPPPKPSATGYSFAISEYVSVNRDAKAMRSLSSKTIRYLHKRRLEERGYRMSSKKLGEGGFGAVYKVYCAGDHSRPMACKIMILCKERKSKKDSNTMLQTFSNEVYVMQSCPHENIVSIKQHFIYSHGRSTEDIRMVHSYIVMDYASLGTLYAKLKKFGPFEEAAARLYFIQTANALAHLHRRGIAHRDLKLGNILLTNENGREVLKLTDFGLSRLVHSQQTGLTKLIKPAGTMSYMAPELVSCYVLYNTGQKNRIRPYDCFGVDMWALGVSLFMLLCKEHPFDSPPAEKAERVEFAKLMLARQRAKDWILPEETRLKLSSACLNMLHGLMEAKYRLRLNIYQVLGHPWLSLPLTGNTTSPE